MVTKIIVFFSILKKLRKFKEIFRKKLPDIKLQIFDGEGAESFEKLRFLGKNWWFFGVLRKNLAKL